MKRYFIFMITIAMIIGLCSCDLSSNSTKSADNEKSYMTAYCSKENVDVFYDKIGKLQGDGVIAGYVLNEENCFNVTPEQVASETNFQIFKFSDSSASFIMIDNEIYALCEWFGGHGFINAVPCDFDNDGNIDLLVASSWGSGLHRSIISVFNSVTKKSTVIYDTSTTDNPQIDLFVSTSSPSFSSTDIYYQVYSVEIKVNNNNFADLSYVATDVVGSISKVNGMIAFVPRDNP